jgi:NAD(P)-dependent dehydrogenase (short-subunit alcohol dehydrogenase family)
VGKTSALFRSLPLMSALPFRSIWIIGASTGIGRAAALAFARSGVTVLASARGADGLASLAAEAPTGTVIPYPLDVTNRDAVLAAVPALETQLGHPLEAMLFCAATWSNDPDSQAKDSAVRPVFEVNIFGCLHALEAVLPGMKARRKGNVALISSVAGFRGLPRALAYGSSKAAMTHMAEALWFECAQANVTMQVIHPGFVRTPLTDKNDFKMPFLMEAEAAARRIVRGMASGGFEITFPRRFTFMLKLLRMLPYSVYFSLVGRATKGK